MSLRNSIHDTPIGYSTRINEIFTEKLSRVSVFEDIDVVGDLNFSNTGAIAGCLGVETPNVSTPGGIVAFFVGQDASFQGNVSVAGDLSCAGDITHSGKVVCLSDLDVFGDLSCAGAVSVGTQLLFNEVSGNVLVGVSSVSGDIVGGLALCSGAGAVLDHSGAIVISADASAPVVSTDVGLFIKPVRGVAHGVGVGVMVYDPVASEMTYSTT